MKKEEKRAYGFAKGVCHIPPGLLIAPGYQKTHQDEWARLWREWTLCTNGGGATTTPDAIAPIISSLSHTNIGSTTATIAWTTNESANGKIYYGTTTPIHLLTASVLSDSALALSHSFNLVGLASSTAYYYLAVSSDATGNTATSSEQSFTTLP